MTNCNRALCACLMALTCLEPVSIVAAAIRTWAGGNNNWDGTAANWSGNDEPDFDDIANFNTPNSVDLAITSQTIRPDDVRRHRPVDQR